jgi:hypothetical protein
MFLAGDWASACGLGGCEVQSIQFPSRIDVGQSWISSPMVLKLWDCWFVISRNAYGAILKRRS